MEVNYRLTSIDLQRSVRILKRFSEEGNPKAFIAETNDGVVGIFTILCEDGIYRTFSATLVEIDYVYMPDLKTIVEVEVES